MSLLKKALSNTIIGTTNNTRCITTQDILYAIPKTIPMTKKAMFSMTPKAMVTRGIIGAILGGLIGRHVTPKIFGYESSPAATNMSTLIDAAMFGGAAAGGPMVGTWLKKDPANMAKLVGGIAASEVMPVAMQMTTQGVSATKDLAEAAKGLKIPPPITKQISDVLATPEARGAGAGAAIAGLASLLTGSLRPRNESELRASRGSMVAKDFLKMVIPAMIAGGVIGNIKKERNLSNLS